MLIPDIYTARESFFNYDWHTGKGSPNTMKKYHVHNFYEIYFLKSGKCNYIINDKTFCLNTNDLVFISPETKHKSIYFSKSFERIVLYFTKDYINSVFDDFVNSFTENPVYVPQNPIIINNIFKDMNQYANLKTEMSDVMVRCYLTELLAYMHNNPSLHSNAEFGLTPKELVQQVQRYICQKYYDDITLTEIASEFGYNSTYFSKLFKKETGINFKEYLLNVRLSAAENFLRTSTFSVSKITSLCGFNDSNHFSNLFKEKKKLSPTEFRNQFSEMKK